MTREDPIAKVLSNHQEISEFNLNLKTIIDLVRTKDSSDEFVKMEDFFKRNIIEHFEYEETEVFPVCLLNADAPDIIALILELKEEHQKILNRVFEWRRLISEIVIPPEKEKLDEINKINREIFDSLLAHASKEDHDLIPFLEKNRQIFNFPET